VSSQYCPQCGTARLGAFRFCRNCRFDFDAESTFVTETGPTTAPAEAAPSTSPVEARTSIATTTVAAIRPVAAGPAVRGGFRVTKRRLVVGSVVALIALGAIGNVMGAPAGAPRTGSPTPSPELAAAPTTAPTSTPSGAGPTVTDSATPEPTPEPTPEATPVPTPEPTLTATTYAKLSARGWSQLVKAPDNYTGRGYLVWGCITQFDAATGTDSFRAQASYQKEDYWYTDGDNVLFSGTTEQLADFVQDDVIYMKVVSLGSFSYDTQIGGNTTVPLFDIVSISRKGSCA
jgi:hypothetical protein